MRRSVRRVVSLLLAALTLSGCAAAGSTGRAEAALKLYYCAPASQTVSADAFVTQTIAADGQTPEELLGQYLQPQAEEAGTLPAGLRGGCSVQSLENGVLTLRLEGTAPEGVQTSLTAACLTLTLTQLDAVDQVVLVSDTWQTPAVYSADMFLLADTAAVQPEYAVTLYYPDKNGTLSLVQRVIRTTDEEQLPQLALQTLIDGEVPAALLRAVPARTKVMDISSAGGCVSVVLSDTFMSCDVSVQSAGNAVRAITATLCAIEGVTSVQLSVIGETGLTYYDISQPLTPRTDWYAKP